MVVSLWLAIPIVKTFPLDSFTSNDHKFKYASYVSLVADEFSPALNEENVGYCWVDIGSWPKPLHPGTKIILNNKNNINKLKTILKRLPSDILVVYINKKAGNPASLLNI